MKTHGLWKIKKSAIKYKNSWIKVREDKVIRPDGKNGIFGVVEMAPGVSVLALDDQGFVYLTEEFRYAIGRDSLEVVSGAINKNESALRAAKRELAEELGIVAEEWIDLGLANPFTSIVKSSANLYLARQIEFSEARPEGTEKINLIRMKFADAVKMVMKGGITHGSSSVLILKAAEFLRKN